MRLPNVEQRLVPDAKVRDYLLDLDHGHGGPKARFFIGHGYARDRWRVLAADLMEHPLRCPVTEVVRRNDGDHDVVMGPLLTLDATAPRIVTVWRVIGDGPPRFITAYPAA